MRRGAAVAFVLSLAVGACNGCRRDEEERKPTAQPQLPPLSAPSPVVTLPVAGFADAVVALPVGATKSVPVLVAVIGIGDTPEEQCAVWRELVGRRAFVLCPRGLPHYVMPDAGEPADDQTGDEPEPPADLKPMQVGFYQPDVVRLDKEIVATLAAAKAKWPEYVGDRDVVYAGFSRGAFLGAQLAAKKPDLFSRVVLVEGGHSPWTDDAATAFAKGGGKRVLFACGQQSCVDDALGAAGLLGKKKIETKTIFGEGEGHGYKKQVKEQLKKHFEWLVEGDPAWK